MVTDRVIKQYENTHSHTPTLQFLKIRATEQDKLKTTDRIDRIKRIVKS